MDSLVVSWFSAGVSSAVATKLALEQYPDLKIYYIDIDDQHKDSLRFVHDCEKWFNKKINILKSPYSCVENVIRAFKYVNGPAGARCSKILKERVRLEFEATHSVSTYIWGFDSSSRERARAERLVKKLYQRQHKFPLIDRGWTKEQAHKFLAKSGIKRPIMYELGYPNNNCIGCVKGGKGYWNKIRKDFPEIFEKRLHLEQEIGRSCINGTFLSELIPEAGRKLTTIDIEDCGIICQNSEDDNV